MVTQYGINYKSVTMALKNRLSMTGKALYLPLRVALSGQKDGPELATIFTILGDKVKARLTNAANL